MQSTNMRQTAAKFKVMTLGGRSAVRRSLRSHPVSVLTDPAVAYAMRAGQIEKFSLNSHEIVRALRYFSGPSAEKKRPCPGASVVTLTSFRPRANA